MDCFFTRNLSIGVFYWQIQDIPQTVLFLALATLCMFTISVFDLEFGSNWNPDYS
jgi:hypothetical protein